MPWPEYAGALLVFSLVGTLLLYGILRLQTLLPYFDAAHLTTALTPDLAANTAISFVTTTTWQAYAGELTITPAGLVGLTTNGGPHGLTEMLFAYTSSVANNGQTFGGLSANSPFYNGTTALAIMVGRFGLAVPALALAGRFAGQGRRPVSRATVPIDSLLFAELLIATAIIVTGLSYFPALALRPIVEHLHLIER